MNSPTHRRRRPHRRRRGGYTLVEVAMGVLLLITAMSLAVQFVGWAGAERRSAERRLWAGQEVANVMERVADGPFASLRVDAIRDLAAARKAERMLPEAEWDVEVVDEPDPKAPARRVALSLRWKDRSGGWTAPVRLVAWFPREDRS